MNATLTPKTGTPTIIRGTKLTAGDRVAFITGRVAQTRDVLGHDSPSIDERTIIATNGTSFAFTRGASNQGTGAYNYVESPESYAVNADEAQAALRAALDERLPYAEQALAAAEQAIVDAIAWRDKVRARVDALRGGAV